MKSKACAQHSCSRHRDSTRRETESVSPGKLRAFPATFTRNFQEKAHADILPGCGSGGGRGGSFDGQLLQHCDGQGARRLQMGGGGGGE
jgi:hypothetical protein